MRFQDAIEEVRNRVNIVDIIGQYVRLKRTGNNYMGLCPFHNEKTPSFSVSESRQIFKCFGCGKGGNVYSFLMEQEGMTFPEAVKYLAAKVNVTIEDDFKQNEELTKKRELFYKLYKDVANTYYSILYSSDGKPGLDYFNYRKLTKETIKKFGLGYAPKSYGFVYKKMKEKGYDDNILFESRLFGIKDDKPYDFFYERVMFPLVDSFGNVVSFQGRILTSEKNNKYINTAESLIYKKSRHLFGINYAKLTKKDYYILCEGNMDVITLHQAGFDNAVASWGTAFTPEQANLIKRKVRKVILSQDTDSAGIKAIESSSIICENSGIDTYVLDLNPVKDADEFIIKFGREAFEKKLENPIPTFLFLIGTLKKTYNLQNAYDYEKYISSIIERLGKIDNSLVREKYVKDVALQENLSLAELEKSVDKYLQTNKSHIETTPIVVKKSTDDSTNYNEDTKLEITFIKTIIDMPLIKDKLSEYISVDEISNNACKYIYIEYLKGHDINKILDNSHELSDEETKRVNDILFSKEDTNVVDIKDRYSILNELIKKIKINNLNNNSNTDIEKVFENNALINEINNKVYTF